MTHPTSHHGKCSLLNLLPDSSNELKIMKEKRERGRRGEEGSEKDTWKQNKCGNTSKRQATCEMTALCTYHYTRECKVDPSPTVQKKVRKP